MMIISGVDSPVLSTFLMMTATWPFNMEFSSLTIRMRQVQRASRDRANKIKPTARSGRSANTNMWVPEEREEDKCVRDHRRNVHERARETLLLLVGHQVSFLCQTLFGSFRGFADTYWNKPYGGSVGLVSRNIQTVRMSTDILILQTKMANLTQRLHGCIYTNFSWNLVTIIIDLKCYFKT